MNETTYYIFGYGSLLNDESRLRSAPHSQVIKRQVRLVGYRRIFNVAYGEHVYANIEPNKDYTVMGTVMQVTQQGYDELLQRERNYKPIDITHSLSGTWDNPVYAFIGTDNTIGTETIKQSYIDLCLSGVEQDKHHQWLQDTIMNFSVSETA